MPKDVLFSLDRIEGEQAVLIGDDETSHVVPLSNLPPMASEGKMYRKVRDIYVEDAAAEQARRDQIQQLQNRLRRRKK